MGTSSTSSSVILPSASVSTLQKNLLVEFWGSRYIIVISSFEERKLHVEESLKPGIEAVIGDLFPELFKLSFVDGVAGDVPSSSKCAKQLSGEVFRFFVHSYTLAE